MPAIQDDHSRECLAIRVKRRLYSTEVIDALADLIILECALAYIRSDNGPRFIAKVAKTACIAPGSPYNSGYC